MSLEIEIHGLQLHGYHGVLERSESDGQTFLFDLELAVDRAGPSDRIEDAVDYRGVVELVRQVSHDTHFQLLEALAAAIADAVRDRYGVERVRVRVRKPQVRPAGMTVDWTGVTVERP